jgi:hypothetical protein
MTRANRSVGRCLLSWAGGKLDVPGGKVQTPRGVRSLPPARPADFRGDS